VFQIRSPAEQPSGNTCVPTAVLNRKVRTGKPSTKNKAPKTKHQAPSTRHQAPGTRHSEQSTKHSGAAATKHKAQSTKHKKMPRNFLINFNEKEGTTAFVQTLDKFAGVEVPHYGTRNLGWEPFDYHECGPMQLEDFRFCLEGLWGDGSVPMSEINARYLKTAKKYNLPIRADLDRSIRRTSVNSCRTPMK